MTTTAQHTQGEWKAYNNSSVTENLNKVGVYYPHAGAYQCIADCSYEATNGASGKEAEANARLIAAAPKLLEALERAVADAGRFKKVVYEAGTFSAMNVAIAAARGQS